jgi:hypothetical protein
MAIQKSITDNTGTAHAEAYVVITGMLINNYADTVRLDVSIYHDAAARSKADPSSTKLTLMSVHAIPEEADIATYFTDSVLDDVGKSPIKQAYAWLKTRTNEWGINFTTGTTDV